MKICPLGGPPDRGEETFLHGGRLGRRGSVLVCAVLVITLVFASQVKAQSFLTNGLVAFYPFNGNANDESGNGNDLTKYGATLCPDRFNNLNNAYYFNGSSYLGSSISPLSQTDNWTVTAWIQPASLVQTAGYAVCVGYDNGYSGDGYAIGISGGNELWAFFPGVGFIPEGYTFLFTNQWHQVVMERRSGTLMFYIDGNSVTNGRSTLGVPLAATSFEVGSGGSFRYFTGAVNDVRVYNRSLAATEVQQLYNYEAANTLLPSIQSQPTNELVGLGDSVSLAVDAVGPAPLLYQWIFNGTNIVNATSSILSLTNLQVADAGTYNAVVSNTYGSSTTSNAVLTVAASPVIELQPESQAIVVGGSATFSVTAFGRTPILYQWTFDSTNIDQATNSTLSLTNAQTAQTGTYSVVITNLDGSIASSNAGLLVEIPPSIAVQPLSQAPVPGMNVTFSVTAVGTALTYQWWMNNSPVTGQTNSTLILTNVTANAYDQFTVVVSNAVGVVTSSPAILSVETGAAFLDPSAFTSLGAFNPSTNVIVDASLGNMSGGASFTGVYMTQAGVEVLVFTFSGFSLNPGVSITFTNYVDNLGVAFLSQGDMTISGVISASGESGGGAGEGGWGTGGQSGGGGGYGGSGGFGLPSPDNPPGGGTYSPDVTSGLACGSSGGTGGSCPIVDAPGGPGGSGGGAVQLAALGSLSVTGSILVNGSDGEDTAPGGSAPSVYTTAEWGSGGGGSGGCILLQAGNVTINSGATLSANGASGGQSGAYRIGTPTYPIEGFENEGGGGGGGRVVVAYLESGINNGTITVSAGSEGPISIPGEGPFGSPGTVILVQNRLVPTFPSLASSLDSSGNFVMSWPSSATNYVLQTSPTLGAGAVWKTATGAVVVGNNFVLTNKTLGVAGFFRLTLQ